MIITGVARPGQVVGHRFPLEAAPAAFANLDARVEGYIKLVLQLA